MNETSAAIAVNLSPTESLRWIREVMAQQRRVDEEQGVLRNVYKRAKAAGEDVKQLRAAVKDSKQDSDEVKVSLRHRLYYLQLRRIDISAEDLFAGTVEVVADRGPSGWDAWEADNAGFIAGRAGTDIGDCPLAEDHPVRADWLAGWNKGQASIARELGPDVELATATRKRPRRARQTRMEGTERRSRPPANGAEAATATAD